MPTSHTPAAPLDEPPTKFDVAAPSPPRWVERWVSSEDTSRDDRDESDVAVRVGERFALLSVTITDARTLEADTLRQAVHDGYGRIFAAAERVHRRHVVRVWNFMPFLHEPLGEQTRYMVFNAGRFDAMCERFGGREAIKPNAPAASGVGWGGDELVVHALASAQPGSPVENRRQVPSYEYSKRYGRQPPCFARATRVGDRLLVAGTAAILGEDSRHERSFDRQLALTLDNLRTLVAGDASGEMDPLRRFTHLRVYSPRSADLRRLREIVPAAFDAAREIEFVSAELCRPELLVEIEGVADCKSNEL